ncbi:hypothetical protein NY547_08990 [Cnuibacter physcomitrellae]|uniref:hypothetical protein n=1 Tax=Cnuibacter physcomitrellae TaxID=1619308 RepID=UPI00217571CA|nr:hypothetical protein [Cnuibacter physcomitrellae]MCS5497369.1 hypothetical protein [Cnuibacter physcomitrellae]
MTAADATFLEEAQNTPKTVTVGDTDYVVRHTESHYDLQVEDPSGIVIGFAARTLDGGVGFIPAALVDRVQPQQHTSVEDAIDFLLATATDIGTEQHP